MNYKLTKTTREEAMAAPLSTVIQGRYGKCKFREHMTQRTPGDWTRILQIDIGNRSETVVEILDVCGPEDPGWHPDEFYLVTTAIGWGDVKQSTNILG